MTLSLVVDNPYRVLGAGTQVKNAVLAANYKALMTQALKGATVGALKQDMPDLIKPPLRTPRRLDLAKSELMSARGRIFHGLFWLMDATRVDHAALYNLATGNRDKAVKLWQSQQSFSSYINLAVLALIEDRFDDAATLYSRCLQDEELTQGLVHCLIGDNFKIKGAFVLSKVLEELNQAKEEKEREDNADERSFVGGGHGILNQERHAERMAERIHLVPDIPRNNLRDKLHLKKQASSFDRHLNEELNRLLERIAQINSEHGMEGDFVEVELNANPAAQLALSEISRFLSNNNALMIAFRERCVQARERTMFLDYIYNLVSITHYVFHLYATELGREYSPALVQQLRSMIGKLKRLYLRLHSDDIDYLIGSLGRVVDALPYYYQIASNFEKFYLLSDDKQLIANFYRFHEQSKKVLSDFNHVFGSRRSYADCSVHLQDMIVRYNVSFMLVLVNLALQYRPKRLQHLNETTSRAVEMELRDAESRMAAEAKLAQRAEGAGKTQSTVLVASAEGHETKGASGAKAAKEAAAGAKDSGLDKAERKLQEEKERQKQEQVRRRGVYFKRKLGRERTHFKQILESFRSYATSSNTLTLVEVTLRQVERLPPPVSFQSMMVLVGLALAALAAIYLNFWFF